MEWFRPRSVPAGEGGGGQSSHCQSNHGSQQLDVAFVSLVSGTVSLLLQSLVGGFTGHFTASRQPMATGKSQNPKVAVMSPTWPSQIRLLINFVFVLDSHYKSPTFSFWYFGYSHFSFCSRLCFRCCDFMTFNSDRWGFCVICLFALVVF